MNNRTGRRVELPLHQPVFWFQLQHFVGVKDVLERWPDTAFICPEDHRQFKCWGDAEVGHDAAHRLQAIFDLYVDLNGGTSEPAGLVSRGVHHVLADPGNHMAGQQQRLAVEGGGLGLCQAVHDLLGDVPQEELLFMLKTSIRAGDWKGKARVLLECVALGKVESVLMQCVTNYSNRLKY